ncbi:hypothetical protein ACFQNE_06890 [Gordonia phosphorivorans]|uniref:Mce-associated membrane protein n=1 Tax=Gordonia phosphorivorans TaxID=1056982 RepID=A0ABV6H4F9_9ACTN
MSSDSPAHDPAVDDVAVDDLAVDDLAGAADDAIAETAPVRKPADTKQAEAGGVAAKAARRAEAAAASSAPGGREFTVTSQSLLRVGLALVAVAAVVAIAVLAWQLTAKSSDVAAKSQTLSAFDEAKSASSAFVTTYFGAMMAPGTTPEKIQATVVPLTTGEARERVEAEAQSTAQFFDEGKFSNMKVEVNSATVESFNDSSATTVVAATLTGTSAAVPAGGQQVVLLQLDLTKQDGKWLVGRMIAQPGVSAAPEQPAPAPAP